MEHYHPPHIREDPQKKSNGNMSDLDCQHFAEICQDFPTGGFLAGSDEAGRGPLAGQVVAATVLLSWRAPIKLSEILASFSQLPIGDSKKLSQAKRQSILTELRVRPAVLTRKSVFCLEQNSTWSLQVGLAEVSASAIDRINIHQASLLAMKKSFERIHRKEITSGTLLVDGKFIPQGLPPGVRAHPVIKGDQRSWPIALASIFAKEFRDHAMARLARRYPDYGFERHAGYPTAFHRQVLERLGPCPHHRRSFRLEK